MKGEFLPRLVLELDRDKPWMEWVQGAVLFADVSGFTPMSEALSVLGAEGGEVLTDVLNRYFAAMISVVHAYGGQVMKFGGDAILCFFPETGDWHMRSEAGACLSPVSGGRRETSDERRKIDSLHRALRAARLMQCEMPRFQNIKTPVKRFALKMKIGVAHGECLLAGVGDPTVRCDYVFAGAPVDATSDAEHHATAGEIVFAGDKCKLQNVRCKMKEMEPGFWRILDAPAEPETRNSKLETAAFPPASNFHLPASASSYLIREVHDLVASGHKAQVGALLEIVPVFLKFTGFTYTREAFDLPLFDAFFRTVMEITERLGGRLNRISMGDKGSTALLLFGAPNPMEKKEQLASQWALDFFAAVRTRFPRLTVGAGLNSGRVFTGIVGGEGRWEYTVMGDAVNFAARLMQGAEMGQACASESFVRKAQEVYGFDDLGTRKFKGKAEPLAVFALKERRKAGWTAGGTEQAVGRERETKTLLERLDRAWNGEPGMAVVEGEAGVGKSFLSVRLLQEATRKGWRTIPAKGEITLRNHAYAPWREIASALLFPGRDPSAEALAEALEEEQRPLLAWFCEFLGLPVPEGTPQPAHDEETRKRLFHHHLSRLLLNVVVPASAGTRPNMEASRTLEGAAAPQTAGELETRNLKLETDAVGHQPVCIFLDDLHWFDTLSLEFLAALLNHLKDQRLFVLAATRPEWEKKDFENRATVSILSLGELDRDGCRTLVESRLGGKVRETLADFLYERTRGNPFFTHQFLDYLLHEDLLETRLGEWLLKRGVEQKGAMTGTEVILAQVNRLPATDQTHLQAAACMGPTFDLAVLRSVLGRSFRTKALEELKRSGYLFIHEELETRNSQLETLFFPHALVQETIYQALPQRVRKRLHRKIGLCMEALHSGDLEFLYPNLANHFHLAGYRAKAVDYCLLAGRQLADQLSYPEACNYYQLARGYLTLSRDPRKWETALALAVAQLRASKLKEGNGTADAVFKTARRRGDVELQVRAAGIAFDARQLMGEYGYIKEANRLLEFSQESKKEYRSFLYLLLGMAYWRTGEYSRAYNSFSELISDNDVLTSIKLRSISPLANIEQSQGHHDRALAHLDAGLRLAEKEHMAHQGLKLAITRAGVIREEGNLEEARSSFIALVDQAERLGDYYLMATIMLNLANVEWRVGDFSAVERYLEEAHHQFSRLGVLNGMAEYHKIKGVLDFLREKYAQAYDHYIESINLNERAQEMQQAWHGYYNLAEVCVKLDRLDEARQWWEKGMASFSEKDNPGLRRMYRELKGQIRS